MADKIKLRRDTLANWEAVNPILDEGELGVILDSNAIVIGDGVTEFKNLQEIPNQELPNEYFNIYKNSKLLFESTSDFYGTSDLVTDLATMKQYILARKTTQHGASPAQFVKIDIASKQETILFDGTASNKDYGKNFTFYYNNIPYTVSAEVDLSTTPYTYKFFIINSLTGTIINPDIGSYCPYSYITINNDLYFAGDDPVTNMAQRLMKYSPSTNTLTILNEWTSPYIEAEIALGIVNGKKIMICRNYEQWPNISFWLYKLNNDWTIKEKLPLDLGHPVYVTTPYIFRKGNKILFTFISRNGTYYTETPGTLFTYEITEQNDIFTFTLRNMYNPLAKEDIYHSSSSDNIGLTGYQFPAILPFSKVGLISIEDNRTTPTFKTKLYQLDYDNDISVDYTDF